jgi:hypothetical protein
MPGASRTRSLARKVKKRTSVVTAGLPEPLRHFPRDGFTVCFVLAPETGLSCLRHPRDHRLAGLISASGYQAHTTSPSA